MQFIVENSNGIPGIIDIRYSVSISNNKPILNLIVRPDGDFPYVSADILLKEAVDGAHTVSFRKQQVRSSTTLTAGVFCKYNPGRNERNEYRSQQSLYGHKTMKGFERISIRDTHIRVKSWSFEKHNGVDSLVLTLHFGKGLIEVKELSAVEPEKPTLQIKTETNNPAQVLKFDPKSFNTPEALEVLKQLAGTGIVLQAA